MFIVYFQDWLDEHFQSKSRDEIILFSNDNVLTPESIQEMYRLYERIENISVNGKKFQDICEKVPIADIFQTKRRRKRETPRQGKILLEDEFVDVNKTDIEDDEDEYYDFWADEYDYDDDNQILKPTIIKPRQGEERIFSECFRMI